MESRTTDQATAAWRWFPGRTTPGTRSAATSCCCRPRRQRASFADGTSVGRTLHGRITKVVAIGAFVEATDGIEGLVPVEQLTPTCVVAAEGDVRVGDEVTVVVDEMDRQRRRLTLFRRPSTHDLR
ncbi:S1 RNA-binding domain-containing protein [Streptomyces xantholiticus]